MTYPYKHPADCETCAKFDKRALEIRDRGFDSETSIKWSMHEAALGREVCYHVFVGVPEWETSGKCATCWRPEWYTEGREPAVDLSGEEKVHRHRNGTACLDPERCAEPEYIGGATVPEEYREEKAGRGEY